MQNENNIIYPRELEGCEGCEIDLSLAPVGTHSFTSANILA